MTMDIYDYNGESVFVNNMIKESKEMDTFPVLIGNEVAHFHDISGGYNRKHGFPVVNLIHKVQGPGSPYRVNTDELSHSIEAHLSDNYYNLDVSGLRAVGEYPDENYILSMKVDSEMHGEHSFSDELTKEIDRRPQWSQK